MVLLLRSLMDLFAQVPISLLMDLINDLSEQIILIHFKDDAFIEAIAHVSVDEARHERVWHAAFRLA